MVSSLHRTLVLIFSSSCYIHLYGITIFRSWEKSKLYMLVQASKYNAFIKQINEFCSFNADRIYTCICTEFYNSSIRVILFNQLYITCESCRSWTQHELGQAILFLSHLYGHLGQFLPLFFPSRISTTVCLSCQVFRSRLVSIYITA